MSTRTWIDTHVHVSDVGPNAEPRPTLLDDLLAVLDDQPADLRFVVSPDGHYLSRVNQSAEGVMESNQFIHGLVSAAPGRLYGSCMVNPNFLDESLHTMDRCFGDWGFVQLGEMLQYMMGYEMDSPPVERLVRHAVEHDVPVHVHISTAHPGSHPSSFGMEQLDDLCRLADRVPEARYILAHAVGMPDDDPPVVEQYLDFIAQRYGGFPGNFWVEIRDFDSPGVPDALARVPADRLLAGTDWVTRVGPPFLPYGCIFGVERPEDNPYPPGVESMVQFLRAAGADDGSIDRIGCQNARALLGIGD